MSNRNNLISNRLCAIEMVIFKKTNITVLLVIFIFLLSSLMLKGQGGKHILSGMVMDGHSEKPLEFASVAIYNQHDSTLVNGTVTNSKGEYIIKGVQSGEYRLKVGFVGFLSEEIKVHLSKDSTLQHDTISLHRSARYLDALTIRTTQNDKEITPDRTSLRVGEGAEGVTGNITDLLKNQPSITIDAENNLYLRGNKNILILIDGRPTSLDMLNAIPAALIDRIDIITNPGAQYDSEGTGGIINIVMKQGVKEGLAGRANISYGLFNRVNGGFSLQMSKKNNNLSFQYNGKKEMTETRSSLIRQVYRENLTISQYIDALQDINVHSLSLRGQVRPAPGHILSGGVRLLLPLLEISQTISGSQQADTTNFDYNRRNEVNFFRRNIETFLNYRRINPDNRYECGLEVYFSRTKGSRPAEYYIEEVFLQRSEGGGAPTIASFQASFIKNYGRSGKLDGGIKYSARWNTFNYKFYSLDTITGTWHPVQMFSNDLIHREDIPAAWLMISDTIAKRVFMNAGVRAEQHYSYLLQKTTGDTITSDRFYPLPFLMLKYHLKSKQYLAFTLNRRITRPTYPQINPWINVIDMMTYESGNKNLKPEVAERGDLMHHYSTGKMKLNSSLWHNMFRDHITQITTLTEGRILVTYINVKRMHKTGVDFDITWEQNRYLTLNFSGSGFYSETKSEKQDMTIDSKGFAWSCAGRLILKPDKSTSLQISTNYTSATPLPQFTLGSVFHTDLTIRRSFLRNSLDLNISITDLFDTRKWLVVSDNTILFLENNSKTTTRIIWAGLSYNLNRYKPPQPLPGGETEVDRNLIRTGQ